MEEFQYQNRRDFLKYFTGSALALGSLNGLSENFMVKKGLTKITILYTNDVHSRIEAFPSNDPKYGNQGGFARRAALIKKIRNEEKNVLLLDSGDIFQGTPYFNEFKGELEYKLMSMMGYDCVTIGNHDFDLGMDNIVRQMPHAKFDFVISNYNLNDTPLNQKTKMYKVFVKDGIRIGVFGLGIELQGLVDKKLYGSTEYLNPVLTARDMAKKLKHEEKCNYIICLSHLGFKSDAKKVNDQILAEESTDIDLIIGAHTHTFLEKPILKKNQSGKATPVTQVGWAGIWLGRYDIYFGKNDQTQTSSAAVIPVLSSKIA
jgi:5'-nucleotidase